MEGIRVGVSGTMRSCQTGPVVLVRDRAVCQWRVVGRVLQGRECRVVVGAGWCWDGGQGRVVLGLRVGWWSEQGGAGGGQGRVLQGRAYGGGKVTRVVLG